MRASVAGVLFVAVGAAGATLVGRWRAAPEPGGGEDRAMSRIGTSSGGPGGVGEPSADHRQQGDLRQEVDRLAAAVAREAGDRQRLEARLDSVAAQLAALGAGAGHAAPARAPARSAGDAASDGPGTSAVDDAASAMERALIAAGVDAHTAADIKRRGDELVMQEMYLRDQARREGWEDSPRFGEEMAAIDAQRTSIREEIGDDAYDRYLFAQGQGNRVRIDDVLSDSPAAQAGLQTGDMIVRYGNARVFTPDDLVAATHDGTGGEAIQLEVIRDGARVEVSVPRGPLGLRIAATRADPAT